VTDGLRKGEAMKTQQQVAVKPSAAKARARAASRVETDLRTPSGKPMRY
jgi:hypothetical protein